MNEVGYKDDAYREEVIQDVAGTMYAGMSDGFVYENTN